MESTATTSTAGSVRRTRRVSSGGSVTTGDYLPAIEHVARAYKPGLILTFASAPDSASNNVCIASSFTPSDGCMPPPLPDEVSSLITTTRLTGLIDQAHAHLSSNVCCIDIAEANPTATTSTMWRMFSFLKHPPCTILDVGYGLVSHM